MAFKYFICASMFLKIIEVSTIRNVRVYEGDILMFRWEDFFSAGIEKECDEVQYELFKDQKRHAAITLAKGKISVHGNSRINTYYEGFVIFEAFQVDSGFYHLTSSCSCTDIKLSDRGINIQVLKIAAQTDEVEIKKIFVGEEVEIVRHEDISCSFKEITWTRENEFVFSYSFEAQLFISSQLTLYSHIEPTDPFILKYPQVSRNHSGIYRAVLKCGEAIITSKIDIKVLQIKDLASDFALGINTSRTKHCINRTYYLPWNASIIEYLETLKLDGFEEVHFSLRFWSVKNIFQPWQRPLTRSKICLKMNEFNTIKNIFPHFFQIKFLQGEHLGLYILKITLRYQNRLIHLAPLFYIFSFVEIHTMSDITTISSPSTLTSEEMCLSKTGFPYCLLRSDNKPDLLKIYFIYEKIFDDCNYWTIAKMNMRIYCNNQMETYDFNLSSHDQIDFSPVGNSSFLIESLRISKGENIPYNVVIIQFLPWKHPAPQCLLSIITSLNWTYTPNLSNAVAYSIVIASIET